MAIKIGTDAVVKVIYPEARFFNLTELNNEVDGFVEPVKIGPIWLMYDEDAKKKKRPLNKVASFFFDVAVYGTVLIVPPQQLPHEWEATEEGDDSYSANDVDSGFLMALQTSLMNHRVFGSTLNSNSVEDFMQRLEPSEEWTYDPPIDAEVDENTIDFYKQVYDYIVRNPDQFRKNVVLKEPSLMVRLENDEARQRMVDQMMTYFVSTEEYEKCAKLKAIL